MQTVLTMGEKIGDLLSSKGINAQKLSADTGIPKATISEIIADKNKNFGYKTIVKISKALKVSVDYLVGLEPEPTNNKDEQFVCGYTGLSLEAIKTLHATQYNYELCKINEGCENWQNPKLNFSKKMPARFGFDDFESVKIDCESICFFINSILENTQLASIAANFESAYYYRTKEKINSKYYNYINFGISNSKKEKEYFEKMKKMGWIADDTKDVVKSHDDTNSAEFELFVLNGEFRDLIEKLSDDDYYNEIENSYLNKKH